MIYSLGVCILCQIAAICRRNSISNSSYVAIAVDVIAIDVNCCEQTYVSITRWVFFSLSRLDRMRSDKMLNLV